MWNFGDDVCERIRKYQENLLEKDGYPWEEYTVTTEDGYINSIYRIPHSNKTKTNNNERRPPVILGHGMTCSSAIFLNQCRLGYYLADEGFDVWLPNNRGTTFSRRHLTLDDQNEKYWDFSWHEIGVYDIPAFVDFVIKQTGFEKVYYIGHSQGTTAYAVLASERPEYNEKIALSCLLGCAISVDKNINSISLMVLIYFLLPLIEMVDRYLWRIHEIPFLCFFRLMGGLVDSNIITHYFALFFMFCLTGHANFEQASELDLNKFAQTTPNSSSVRQMFHYRQIIQRRSFTKYDYGPKKNLKKYGSTEPPPYDLSKVTSPVALFYGKNDMFNDYKEDDLDGKMANVVHLHVVEDDRFNHVDFLIAKDSVALLYRHVVKLMKRYGADH